MEDEHLAHPRLPPCRRAPAQFRYNHALDNRGIEFAAGGAPRSITGHIDFLQVPNDAVHILDYKPDARTNKPIVQLAIYALALKLFDIKCAWFNKEEYNEFFPHMLLAKR